MLGRLLIMLLSVLPKHGLSALAGWLANRRVPRPLRPAVYGAFCAVFGADRSEAEHPVDTYDSVNAFFRRGLKPGARPVATSGIACPADGAAGASGVVEKGTLVQAKGRTYSVAALVADPGLAAELEGGTYLTVYLSPKDYHHFHSPLAAAIPRCTYVPGDLWPVNRPSVAHVDQLFARNERLVVEMRTPAGGLMVVVPVGATMVGMTRVVFDDVHTNARRRQLETRTYQPPVKLEAGARLGHFEFGSTVILCCARSCGTLEPLPPGTPLRVGQRVGDLAP
jgi:phosphatidylserine decarboxylase